MSPVTTNSPPAKALTKHPAKTQRAMGTPCPGETRGFSASASLVRGMRRLPSPAPLRRRRIPTAGASLIISPGSLCSIEGGRSPRRPDIGRPGELQTRIRQNPRPGETPAGEEENRILGGSLRRRPKHRSHPRSRLVGKRTHQLNQPLIPFRVSASLVWRT